MSTKIRVAILDDHQSIVDGYMYRLGKSPHIQVVGAVAFGEELEPLLARHPADVVLLDVHVPTSRENGNPYPILNVLARLLQAYPNLAILVISMHAERALIKAVMEAGANGYVLKDDQATLRDLGAVVQGVAAGGIYFSHQAHQLVYRSDQPGGEISHLTPRQLEALSLCAAYPDLSTADLARRLGVTNSTVRNLLSGAYLRLGVNSRAAAITKARSLNLITPAVSVPNPWDLRA